MKEYVNIFYAKGVREFITSNNFVFLPVWSVDSFSHVVHDDENERVLIEPEFTWYTEEDLKEFLSVKAMSVVRRNMRMFCAEKESLISNN